MTAVRAMGRQIVSLFLDDGFLALGSLLVVGAAAILVHAFAVTALAGAVLLGGCLVVLVASVWRTTHPRRDLG